MMMFFQVFYIECNKDKSHNVLLPMESYVMNEVLFQMEVDLCTER